MTKVVALGIGSRVPVAELSNIVSVMRVQNASNLNTLVGQLTNDKNVKEYPTQ